MNKIKEKKLNSIKSEIEEIKNFIETKKNLDISEQNRPDFDNDSQENTLTLTKIFKKEDIDYNNSDLDNIKKELEILKSYINHNKTLLEEILARIK